MSTSPTSTIDAQLEALAEALDEVVATDGEPLAVGVAHADTDLELSIRPFAGHPADELIGFRAPEEWTAFGIAAPGRAFPLPDHAADEGAAPPDASRRIRLVHLVARSGLTHVQVRGPDDTAVGGPWDVTGSLDDVCRRVLALPTARPASTPADLWTRLWLDALVGLDPDELLCWSDVAGAHPAVEMVAASDPSMRTTASEHLVSAGRALSRIHTWEGLRQRCAAGELRLAGLEADAAGWFDEGSFARWILGWLPEIPDLCAAALASLPNPLARQVADTLDAWGFDPHASPTAAPG